MKEMESKKRILEEAVDSLNEEIAKLKAKGKVNHMFKSESRDILTAVKREKFTKNKKNTSKERLSFLLFKLWYLTSILLIY